MRFITNICCVLVLLLFSSVGWSQIIFEAEVSRDSIGINERFEVRFTMNQDGEDFNPPNFENFKVVVGPMHAVSYSRISGEASICISYSYYLFPEKKGDLEIGSATINFEGNVYESNVVSVKVGDAVQSEKDYIYGTKNDLEEIEKKVFLEREISNTNPFVNEPISVIYKLYVSNDFGVENVSLKSIPKYENFLIDIIKESEKLVVQEIEYKQKIYRYAVIREVVLVPLKEGELTLDPLELNLEIASTTGRLDIFGDLELITVEEVRSTGTSIINVKPLSDTIK
ncbi:hypothetical protein EG240_14305 [Paenimyroides tangerinum]|uniref:BatD protein n=1 Tax=Paenimyroides tangerinum TaxID=2488728 RepID=A0A3P3W2C2_9FLAO|nr:BatD family protein [Paenimyroides tangerinum]RRJ88046.1 hypothetical protein EG240_14305 [Paenimyroides tangerinum]